MTLSAITRLGSMVAPCAPIIMNAALAVSTVNTIAQLTWFLVPRLPQPMREKIESMQSYHFIVPAAHLAVSGFWGFVSLAVQACFYNYFLINSEQIRTALNDCKSLFSANYTENKWHSYVANCFPHNTRERSETVNAYVNNFDRWVQDPTNNPAPSSAGALLWGLKHRSFCQAFALNRFTNLPTNVTVNDPDGLIFNFLQNPANSISKDGFFALNDDFSPDRMTSFTLERNDVTQTTTVQIAYQEAGRRKPIVTRVVVDPRSFRQREADESKNILITTIILVSAFFVMLSPRISNNIRIVTKCIVIAAYAGRYFGALFWVKVRPRFAERTMTLNLPWNR